MTAQTAQRAADAAERVRRAAVKIAAIAQSGLAYSPAPFDVDRYEQLAEVAAGLLSVLTDRPTGDLHAELGRDSGYATPKIDVRGGLVDEHGRVLLTRERDDGRWALPGGWADVGDTPTGSVLREVREETGHSAEVLRLVGCWDRDVQGHLPPLPVHVVKLVFLCRDTGSVGPPEELETLETGWFALDQLPELSGGRTTRHQVERVLAHHRDPSLATEVD